MTQNQRLIAVVTATAAGHSASNNDGNNKCHCREVLVAKLLAQNAKS
jgi:hypothetical protein